MFRTGSGYFFLDLTARCRCLGHVNIMICGWANALVTVLELLLSFWQWLGRDGRLCQLSDGKSNLKAC